VTTALPRPWYREPMVWLVVALPLSVVVAGFSTLAIAIRAGGTDASSDRVQRTAQIQVTDLSADTLAMQLGLHGRVAIDADSGALKLTLIGMQDAPAQLDLQLSHPIDARRDQRLSLVRAGDAWLGRIDPARDHDWQMKLSPLDQRWRLLGRIRADQSAAELRPQFQRG